MKTAYTGTTLALILATAPVIAQTVMSGAYAMNELVRPASVSPAGCIVESFTDPERDPLQAELFEDPPRIANGRLTLKEAPGLGLTLSQAALAKFGERIL